MPKLKSAKKQVTRNRQHRTRNKGIMSAMRSATRAVDQATDVETATAAVRSAISIIDKTARLGVIHPNKAARCKSRLTRRINAMT